MNLSATPRERVLLIGTYDLGHQPFGISAPARVVGAARGAISPHPVARYPTHRLVRSANVAGSRSVPHQPRRKRRVSRREHGKSG
jgi:hypothetical protein